MRARARCDSNATIGVAISSRLGLASRAVHRSSLRSPLTPTLSPQAERGRKARASRLGVYRRARWCLANAPLLPRRRREGVSRAGSERRPRIGCASAHRVRSAGSEHGAPQAHPMNNPGDGETAHKRIQSTERPQPPSPRVRGEGRARIAREGEGAPAPMRADARCDSNAAIGVAIASRLGSASRAAHRSSLHSPLTPTLSP